MLATETRAKEEHHISVFVLGVFGMARRHALASLRQAAPPSAMLPPSTFFFNLFLYFYDYYYYLKRDDKLVKFYDVRT